MPPLSVSVVAFKSQLIADVCSDFILYFICLVTRVNLNHEEEYLKH